LQAGSVWFNSEQLIPPQAAWGGYKRSGIGRELGPWGLASYQEVKHLIGPAGSGPADQSPGEPSGPSIRGWR